MQDTGRSQEAEESYRRAITLQQTLLAQDADDRYARSAQANTQHNLATLLMDANRLQEAEQVWRQAVAGQEKLVADFASVPEYREALAKSFDSLGMLLRRTRRPQESQEVYQKALGQRTKLVANFPDVPSYRRGLAHTHNNLGLLLGSDRPDEAEKAHRDALEIRRKLAADFPAVPDPHSELAGTLNNLALLRIERGGAGDLQEARQLLSQAVTHQQTALKTNPHNPTYRQFLRNHYWNLAETLVRLGDHGEAAQAAAELPRLFPSVSQEYYGSAGFLARCIPLAENDLKFPEPERQTLAQSYGERAVALLKEAIKKGYKDAKQLDDEMAFAPLRTRDDFKRLLNSLKRNAK